MLLFRKSTNMKCSIIKSIIIYCVMQFVASNIINENVQSETLENDEFYKEFMEFFNTEMISNSLNNTLNMLNIEKLTLDDDDISMEITTNKRLCKTCRLFAASTLKYYQTYGIDDKFENFLLKLCEQLTFSTKDKCLKNSMFLPTIKFILKERGNSLTVDTICGILLQANHCGTPIVYDDFKINIDDDESVTKEPKTQISLGNKMKNLTIVQLTDFHYDPLYASGSIANCRENICCRNSSQAKNDNQKIEKAGKWSDFHICDSPGYLIENACNTVRNQYKDIDYIYYTGDIVDHFAVEKTRESILESIKFVTDVLKETFGNIPIIPIIGNHDTHPVNLFAPSTIIDPELNNKWLYDFIANEWSTWLPKEATDQLRKYGYYTFLLRNNLRIIAINNNVCFLPNYWLLYGVDVLMEQLEWMYETLKMAENSNEKVHILAHIASNTNTCIKVWDREYLRIINRFSHIIHGQFNGHSHKDEFLINFEKDIPVNVAWNGGSIASFIGVNPNFRVYYVDDTTYEVLDHDTWIFNLTEANDSQLTSPNWFKEYSFKEKFNVKDLSPKTLSDFVSTALIEPGATTFQQIWKINVKQSDQMLKQGCNDKCIYDIFCSIVNCK